jgi:hypothetical protein
LVETLNGPGSFRILSYAQYVRDLKKLSKLPQVPFKRHNLLNKIKYFCASYQCWHANTGSALIYLTKAKSQQYDAAPLLAVFVDRHFTILKCTVQIQH